MPLRKGYSRGTIGSNVGRERRAGRKPGQAVAIAMSEARRSYRRSHPRGRLPGYLENRRRNPSSGPDVGTLLLVGFGAWLLLGRRGAATPTILTPAPQAPDPGPCAGRPFITYQQWWERYQNNNQPAPAGRVFPDSMVPDCPAGPTYASALASSEGIPARRGLFG